MMTVRDSQMQSMANSAPGRQMVMPCKPTWIEVRLVDKQKRPLRGEKYRIRLPDASLVEGTLDDEGKVRLEGIVAGQCQVCFPEIDGREWRHL